MRANAIRTATPAQQCRSLVLHSEHGLTLRQLREQQRLSVRELAEKAGVDWSAINRIELGKANPRLDTLEKLAKALGVGLRDLMEGGK